MSTPKHLYRSSEPMVAGVCGGIAEYFDVDPTFARVLAIVLMIASAGTFLLFYFVATVVIPKNPAEQSEYINATSTQHATNPGTPSSSPSGASAYAYADSATPVNTAYAASSASAAVTAEAPAGAATGASASPFTVSSATASPTTEEPAQRGSVQDSVQGALKKRWSAAVCVGLLLITIGVLALLANLVNLSFWRFWPIALIVLGIAQLFTPSANGWSLERAGGALVLISFGLLIQTITLGMVSVHALLVAFGRLWPMLLIVLGLNILAGAKKMEAFSLLASLLFSATLLIGVWLFGGIDGTVSLHLVDGGELTIELPASPMPPPDETSRRFAAEVSSFTPFHLEP